MDDSALPVFLLIARPEFAVVVSQAFEGAAIVEVSNFANDADARLRSDTRHSACLVSDSVADASTLDVVELVDSIRPALPRIVLTERRPRARLLRAVLALDVRVASWPIRVDEINEYLGRIDSRARAQVAQILRNSFDEAVARSNLTERSAEVAWKAVLGADTKDIAALQGVDLKTVKSQRQETLKCLKVGSIDELRWRTLRRVLPSLDDPAVARK